MWLLVATVAQFILGTSAVFDKLLLGRKFFDPWTYTFWVAILGLAAFILAPFGFAFLPVSLLVLAFFTGAIFISALFLLFYALHKGEASTTFLFIGSISPIATLLIGEALLRGQLKGGDYAGFFFLVIGSLLLFLIEKKELHVSIILLSLASAFLFGLYGVLAKIVFEQSSFIAGFISIKSGAALFVLSFLAIPYVRKSVSSMSRASASKQRFLYVLNGIYAGIGSTLIAFAISLGHPALVDATQGLKYIVIFVAAWILLHERSYGKILFGKIVATCLIIIGVFWLGVTDYARGIPVDPNRPITWGVTFSSKFSKQLGLDWQKTLDAILYEARPRKIRAVAYWDEIEKERGIRDFSELDWQMDRAAVAGARVVLAIGMRVPRWPECHIPEWARVVLPDARESALREYLEVVIARYRDHPALERWQLENEPFLPFGLCPEREKDFFEKERELLKSLDRRHPILVSDSGEFGTWYEAIRAGDVFGTTMFRKVYPPSVGWFTGIVEYPLAPSHFRFKEKVLRWILGEYEKPFIVIELQGEPWGPKLLQDLPYEEQIAIFSPEYFRDTIQYARDAGFNEYYLWGAEWWWSVKEKHSDSRYWSIAKTLF